MNDRHAITIDSVWVGQPQLLGTRRGTPVYSAITKDRVHSPAIDVGVLGLSGDGQADLTSHGGPDKAVYAYPLQHYRSWQQDGFELNPGDVGENLVVSGTDETEVRIGSIWAWGQSLVQVTQPRTPCFKLTMKVGRKDIGPKMISTVRSGWYLRVLSEGPAPTTGDMTLVAVEGNSPTVHETFQAIFAPDGLPPGTVQRVLECRALADQWRDVLRARQPATQT